MTLREILHAHIPTLCATSTVRDAVDKMDIYQFPALVVVDERSCPIAVITEGDICRAISQRGSLMKLGREAVLTFATAQPTVATLDTEVSEALHQMLNSGLTLLPVVDEARLMGVVLRVDLMQAMLMDLSPETSKPSTGEGP